MTKTTSSNKATIILAKNLNLKKMEYPCVASEKLDGVPAVFLGSKDGSVSVQTRQGEPILSVEHIKEWLFGLLPEGHELIGELHVAGMSFKDIGGLVRRHEQSPNLVLNIWDYNIQHRPYLEYQDRMKECAFGDVGKFVYDSHDNEGIVRFIEGVHIADEAALLSYIGKFTDDNPFAEGLIFRPLTGKNSLYEPNKRSWGFQRYKGEETVDLKLVGFEEAVTGDTKEGKGMVGRIIALYKGNEIGVGPGALTHGERIYLWANPETAIGHIIEVAYKPDPTYEALREARFKRFRHDKDEPNIE